MDHQTQGAVIPSETRNLLFDAVPQTKTTWKSVAPKSMGEMMIPFEYVEFYDVPRLIILLVREKWILLQSAFDEDLDDYEPAYSVYQLPSSFESPRAGRSWDFLRRELTFLGKVPVQDVEFDPTKRRTLRAAALDGLIPD